MSFVKAWKAVKLGLHKSSEEYRKALKESKYYIGGYADRILDNIPISQEEVEVDLALVRVRQLGFKSKTRRDVIYGHALERGLHKCPAEVGPALREQYPNSSELILIGMEPVVASNGRQSVFGIECHGSELWLGTRWGDLTDLWPPDLLLAFCLPRK